MFLNRCNASKTGEKLTSLMKICCIKNLSFSLVLVLNQQSFEIVTFLQASYSIEYKQNWTPFDNAKLRGARIQDLFIESL